MEQRAKDEVLRKELERERQALQQDLRQSLVKQVNQRRWVGTLQQDLRQSLVKQVNQRRWVGTLQQDLRQSLVKQVNQRR